MLHLLETATHTEVGGAPPIVFGIIAFGVLVGALLLLMEFGASRPHE